VSDALKVVLVDDEAPARSRLKELIADCAALTPAKVVGEAANGREALELLGSVAADLVLVDIRMPQMSGIEFAQHALALDAPPAIIFVSAYDEYAIKAFELRALDYLLKPVRRARLQAALERARGLRAPGREELRGLEGAPRRNLSVPERGRIRLVPVADIVYLKAELKYVTIRTAEHEYLLEESLTHLEQEFADAFVRVHRNALVAKARIRGFEKVEAHEGEHGWVVLLEGCAEKLPVSRRQWPLVKELATG
jgi:two-component system, LytTR family, response regulator AlgR